MGLKRETIKRGIAFSVSISVLTLIAVMLWTQSDFSLRTFSRFKSDYLILASALTISFWILKSLKLQVLVNVLGSGVAFHRVFSIYLASAFVAHVTPSSFGGLPFQIYFLHREGLPLGKTTALTVLDGMLTFIFFMVATPFLLLIWGEHLNVGPKLAGLFYIAVILLVLFVCVSLILIFNAGLAKTFINWLTGLNWLKKAFSKDKLAGFRRFVKIEVDLFNDGIRIMAAEKRGLFLVILYTTFYWCAYLAMAPVLLLGLGLEVAIPPVILAQLVFNFIQPIIPTPGGSGGAELGFAYLFQFMVPPSLLGVFVAIWRFFMFYTSLVVGGLYFVHLVQGTDYLDND